MTPGFLYLLLLVTLLVGGASVWLIAALYRFVHPN